MPRLERTDRCRVKRLNLTPFLLADAPGLTRDAMEDAIRVRSQTVFLGDGLVLARVLGRFKMYLDAGDVGFAGHVMLDGFWESWLTRFLAQLVRPGMHAIDVGANFGYHTLALADLCGAEGSVLAVEPNPKAASLLRRTMALNGFAGTVAVLELALGADEARAMLVIPAGEPKNATLMRSATAEASTSEVRVAALDALLAPDAPVDVVKIDAEGAEPAILEGGRQMLARHRPHLILEFNAARYRDPAAVLEPLLRLYGGVQRIGFDGDAHLIERADVLVDGSGEDQLLYFARA